MHGFVGGNSVKTSLDMGAPRKNKIGGWDLGCGRGRMSASAGGIFSVCTAGEVGGGGVDCVPYGNMWCLINEQMCHLFFFVNLKIYVKKKMSEEKKRRRASRVRR